MPYFARTCGCAAPGDPFCARGLTERKKRYVWVGHLNATHVLTAAFPVPSGQRAGSAATPGTCAPHARRLRADAQTGALQRGHGVWWRLCAESARTSARATRRPVGSADGPLRGVRRASATPAASSVPCYCRSGAVPRNRHRATCNSESPTASCGPNDCTGPPVGTRLVCTVPRGRGRCARQRFSCASYACRGRGGGACTATS